jgi:signal transduction histidine kinase
MLDNVNLHATPTIRPDGSIARPAPQQIPARRTLTWLALTVAVTLAASTWVLRTALGYVGLQGLAFIIPALLAAFWFGSRLATIASALTLIVVHLIVWRENPQLFLTRPYVSGIANYLVICGLIVLYTRRHEQVLTELDMSLARETAARAQAEDASRLKDQFLATLSHELRTPINVILGYLQMLLRDRTSNPRRALEIVDRNAQHQARLIEDVLDASRITTGTLRLTLEEVCPVPLMREVMESLQPEIAAKHLRLELVSVDDRVAIIADPKRLRQVFWNLLSNAVKFTPARGAIAIRIDRDDREVAIRMSDTGRGISPEFLPYAFEMFRQGDPSSTRDVSGMGLGLGLVKRFVELQNGSVSAESDGEGRGATFTCRFAVCQPAALAAENPVLEPTSRDTMH